VGEGAPRLELLNQSSLLEAPKQFIDPYVLYANSAYEFHIIFILVEELLHHVVPHEHQNHFSSILFPPLHLHHLKPSGPGNTELSSGELLDSCRHFPPLGRPESYHELPYLLIIAHYLFLHLIVLYFKTVYDFATPVPQSTIFERLPIHEV
jgi:hypothetical protein